MPDKQCYQALDSTIHHFTMLLSILYYYYHYYTNFVLCLASEILLIIHPVSGLDLYLCQVFQEQC